MDIDEYKKAIKFYGEKFKLKSRWVVSIIDSFSPELKMNYNAEKAIACTNCGDKTVLFKSKLLTMPKFLARAYIRHELRHCLQMEVINKKMREKYGDNLSSIYTQMVIAFDNQNGYKNSLMEADAWLAFFGIYMDINKVTDRIIKSNFVWF